MKFCDRSGLTGYAQVHGRNAVNWDEKILNPGDLDFDVVICTHLHLDHFDIDTVPELMSSSKTRLFCSVDCEKLVHQMQMEYDCAALAAELKPGVTIPCHYGMCASHHGDVGMFYDIMTEKRLPILLMRQGEQYTL